MKKILYFVFAGFATQGDKDIAKELADNVEGGAHVVFRNADACGRENENPEACDATFGPVTWDVENKSHTVEDVPAGYQNFPRVDESGTITGKLPLEVLQDGRNSLGLPEGHPDNREELMKALTDQGVQFHKNSSNDRLVALYREKNNLTVE